MLARDLVQVLHVQLKHSTVCLSLTPLPYLIESQSKLYLQGLKNSSSSYFPSLVYYFYFKVVWNFLNHKDL